MGPASVGLYGAAVQLTDTWTFMPTLIIGSLYPATAGMYYSNHAEYTRRMKLLTMLALSIAVVVGAGIVLFAPFIVKIVYGDAFQGVVPILRIYTVYVPIAVVYAILQNHLTTSNKTRTLVLIGIIGAIVNIALNIVLIPIYGAVGATLATIIAGSIMIFIPFLMHTRRRVPASDPTHG
jgi:O-antigen/teichoic acid export membrane protein